MNKEQNYLTEEQTTHFIRALLATEERTTLETLANALEGNNGHKETQKALEDKAGSFDRVVWHAIEALTGRTVDNFDLYGHFEEVRDLARANNSEV